MSERSSNHSINYNTSIIDLKPFRTHDYQQTLVVGNAPDNDRFFSSYSMPYSAVTTLSSASSSSSSSTSTSRSAAAAYVSHRYLPKKKFLINRNMRFYEPVKDAEMLVELHLLRSKLHLNLNYVPNVLNHSSLTSKQSIVKKRDDFNYAKAIDLRRSILPGPEKQANPDEDRTVKRERTYEDISSNYTSSREFASDKQPQQPTRNDLISVKTAPVVKSTRQANDLNLVLTNDDEKQSSNLPKITDQTRHKHVFNVIKKSSKSRMSNIYKSADRRENELASTIDAIVKSQSNETIDDVASSRMFSARKLKLSTRQQQQQHSSADDSCDDSKCEFNHNKRHLANVHNIYHFGKTPTNPNSAAAKSSKLKNKKSKTTSDLLNVSNIISDIPSTLITMSGIGQVTNVERLIADKLTNFYSKNRLIK